MRTSAFSRGILREAKPVFPPFVTLAVAVRYFLPRERDDTVPSPVKLCVTNSDGSSGNSDGVAFGVTDE